MDGFLGAGGLGTSKMLGGLEGADRFAIVVVGVLVGHVDATVEDMKSPMSNFLYFLLFCNLLLLFLQKLVSHYWDEGIETSLHNLQFLPNGRNGLHLSAPGAI